jgi:hypothetical protein
MNDTFKIIDGRILIEEDSLFEFQEKYFGTINSFFKDKFNFNLKYGPYVLNKKKFFREKLNKHLQQYSTNDIFNDSIVIFEFNEACNRKDFSRFFFTFGDMYNNLFFITKKEVEDIIQKEKELFKNEESFLSEGEIENIIIEEIIKEETI